MPSQEQRQQVSTEHQDGRESDNHQRDVVEFPRAVGVAIEDNRNNEDERTTRKRDTRFGQAHARVTGLAGAALQRDRKIFSLRAPGPDHYRSIRREIPAHLANGGALKHSQEMAAHESPRTTRLYDRTKERLKMK
jgi:hypothetical protein